MAAIARRRLPAIAAILFYWIRMKVVQQLTCRPVSCWTRPSWCRYEALARTVCSGRCAACSQTASHANDSVVEATSADPRCNFHGTERSVSDTRETSTAALSVSLRLTAIIEWSIEHTGNPVGRTDGCCDRPITPLSSTPMHRFFTTIEHSIKDYKQLYDLEHLLSLMVDLCLCACPTPANVLSSILDN